jgi:hypothetical protein
LSTASFGVESLSYSGRLVNTNGSPIAGPVNLKVELSYTSAPSTILCSQNISNVALSNGVFHLKVDLDCGTDSLTEVLAAVPAGEAASLRVTDLSHSKTYSFQAIHAVPFSNTADISKQIVQMGATNGQVLQWNNTSKKWEPGTITLSGGTVTNVSVNAPLTIANPASTPSITLPQANTTTNGYLSSTDWNTFNSKQPLITAGVVAQYYRGDKSWQTLDTSVVPENVANLYFTNARVLGVPLTGFTTSSGAIVATDTILSAFEKAQGQINSIGAAGNNYLVKNSSDSITGAVNVSITGALTITNSPALPTDAANKQYVDTKLNLTGGTLSGDLNLDTQLKLKGATNYVTVKAHATSGTYNFILPQTAGTSGYVLQTDGSGNLAWINPASTTQGANTVDSASIVDGSIVDADVNATAAIAQSKIANLTTDLSTINTSITGINSTLSGLTTTAVPEGTNKYFTDTRAIAAPLTGFSAGTDTAIVAADTTLQAFDKSQGQINNRVKKTGDTMSGILTLDSDLKIKGGSNYVTLRGHASSAAYNFIFPQTAGTSGYVLQTDGAGNLSWINPSTVSAGSGTVDSTSIANGSIVDADVNATAAIAQSKISNLTTDLAAKVSTTLANGNILIGNGINVATAVTVSGDAALSNAGVLTLANTAVSAGTYSSVTVDGKGRVTGGTNPTVVTGVSVTAPVTIAGTAAVPLIGMPAATGAVDGYLSSANFTTFNNKQNAITSATDITTGSITTSKQNGLNVNPFAVGAGNTGEARFYELVANGTNYTGFKSPDVLAGNVIYILPVSDGTSGQVLTTNAAGVLSWSSIPSSMAPNGAAGGDLTGTYPNPTINNANLIALKSYNTNGFLVQTAANTFTGRSVVGTANRVTMTDGNGVSGNPTINVDTGLLPSPVAGDSGKFLKSTGANTAVWGAPSSADIISYLGFTPVNKGGDSIATGIFNFNGAAVIRTLDPVGPTDVATKQYVDQFGQWIKNASNLIFNTGSVGVGAATVNSSAIFELTSTTKGFLPPRMNTTQRDAIATPATGLTIYNSSTQFYEYYNGSGWNIMGGGIPNGAISAFDSTSCPTGWVEYTAARGQFLRGIDNGAGVDPSGTRAPGNPQADSNKAHNHVATETAAGSHNHTGTTNPDGAHAHSITAWYPANTGALALNDWGTDAILGTDNAIDNGTGQGFMSAARATNGVGNHTHTFTTSTDGSHAHAITVNNDGGTESRPKNIAVLFCKYMGGTPSYTPPSVEGLANVNVTAPANGQALIYDSATSKWINQSVGGALGFNPVNKAGDTMTGTLTVPTMRFSDTSTQTTSAFGPVWSVYTNTATATSTSVYVKIQYNLTEFDTDSSLDAANSRIKPTKAGYYKITLTVALSQTGNGGLTNYFALYKNGAAIRRTDALVNYGAGYTDTMQINTIVYMNGTTDYLEGWFTSNNSTSATTVITGAAMTNFNGEWIRP